MVRGRIRNKESSLIPYPSSLLHGSNKFEEINEEGGVLRNKRGRREHGAREE